MNEGRLSPIWNLLVVIACLGFIAGRSPEGVVAPEPKPALAEWQQIAVPSMSIPDACPETVAVLDATNSMSSVLDQVVAPSSATIKSTFGERHRKWMVIGISLATIMLAFGIFGWSESRKRDANALGNKSKGSDSREFPRRTTMAGYWKGILVGLAFAVALVGGTLLAMLVFGIGFPAFGLALLATLCTIAAMAALFVVGMLIVRALGPAPNSGNHTQKLGSACFYVFIALFIVLPLAVIVGALTMGLFLPVIVGITAHFGTSLLAALCMAAPLVGALALTYELVVND